jgi:hypothetical protein
MARSLPGPDLGLSLLERKDWELFWRYPMMRGYGASPSSRRLVYMGLLKYLHGDSAGSEECIRRAETAIRSWYP